MTDGRSGRIDRRGFLGMLGAAGGWLEGVALAGEAARQRPLNFVLILVDDLGWTDLACFGSRYFETPHLDRLATQGMRFTNAYAACAVCSPTRAAVMTGRYPARVGVTDWIRARFQGGKVPPGEAPPEYVDEGRSLVCPRNPFWMELEERTLAEALKVAGYTSCHIGKWHLGTDEYHPDKQGFDFNIGGCDYGQPPSYFDPYRRKGQHGIPTLAPRQAGEYLTDREADEAARFIRAHRDRPFFLYMAHYAVHTPLQAKPELVAKYKAKTPTNQKNPVYAAMIESMDAAAGRILQTIDDEGLAANTVVIFTSDNGGLLGSTHNAPLRAGKGYAYEGGIRVPLIVRWPGVARAGAVCEAPVTSVDYFPTLLALAGAEPPADRAIDGVSLAPLLKGAGDLGREAIFWHFPHYRGQDVVPYSIVRAGDWKLIKRYEGTEFEMFNLREDLSEEHDVAAQMPARVKELDARLRAWLRETGAKMPKKRS